MVFLFIMRRVLKGLLYLILEICKILHFDIFEKKSAQNVILDLLMFLSDNLDK